MTVRLCIRGGNMKPPFLMQISKWLLLLVVLIVKVETGEACVKKPGCQEMCGNVSISYPFGIGANCSYDTWFEIECKPHPKHNSSHKPFLSKFNLEVIEFSTFDYDAHKPLSKFNLTVDHNFLTVGIPPFNSCTAAAASQHSSINLKRSPYKFTSNNLLLMEGCQGVFMGYSALRCDKTMAMINSCDLGNKTAIYAPSTDPCFEANCCTTYLKDDFLYYHIKFFSPSGTCLFATLVRSDYADEYVKTTLLTNPQPIYAAPVELSWKLYDIGCYNKDRGELNGYGYGYGYGYDDHHQHGFWYNLKNVLKIVAKAYEIRFGIGLGCIILYYLYRYITKKMEMKRRCTYFEHNGGLLLKQQLPSGEGVVGRTKIFTMEELNRATNHFDETQILGKGGFGTVYKGTLVDGDIVAIKKSKQLDTSLLNQFINEVVILSQTNHRNVVKLLGCCLETKVPLLIYEYVSNGTLSEKIHQSDEEGSFMSWEMRLKIAVDSASAVAYLHSLSSTPIYHRDIKSSNILLDERHRAKVADFGCSRNIEIDQTHLTTLVQGTWGYLDPEYYQTRRFTEKSDVYSFGVVLLELLTSKKAVYNDETGDVKSLVLQFEKSESLDMLDQRVVEQASEEQLRAVVELAKRCVRMRSGRRPAMKEVAMKLDMVTKSPSLVSNSTELGYIDEYGEDVMSQISEEGFMSIPLPARDDTPLCIDEPVTV